jgi:hypothetical protein
VRCLNGRLWSLCSLSTGTKVSDILRNTDRLAPVTVSFPSVFVCAESSLSTRAVDHCKDDAAWRSEVAVDQDRILARPTHGLHSFILNVTYVTSSFATHHVLPAQQQQTHINTLPTLLQRQNTLYDQFEERRFTSKCINYLKAVWIRHRLNDGNDQNRNSAGEFAMGSTGSHTIASPCVVSLPQCW